MQMKENQLLAPFTTFGIGGPARWFVEATSEAEIVEALTWARERGVRLFVLGGGSNLLVSDAGFDGLVLHIGGKGELNDVAQEGDVFRCGAGRDWDGFVSLTVERGFAGIECLAGIPGTVGGTPVQNVGAYGQEVDTVIERVRAFDLEKQEFVELRNAECGFEYRRSRFNSTDRGRFIVTRVDYRLASGGAPTLRYADLQRAIRVEREHSAEPSLGEVAEAVRRVRRSKGMLLVDGDPDCRSAGSFFKNPVVTEGQLQVIARKSAKHPPRFPVGPGHVKIPAAWLIEQAGFSKGYVLGNAGISSRHTLAIINRGGASTSEVLLLANRIISAVESGFGIQLEMELVLMGF
jgi:UDP-N-acetylmuramate dehydrogenase